MRGQIGVLALVAVILGACGQSQSPAPSPVAPSDASVIPVPISSEQVVGPNRYVFSFIDATTNQPVAAPDRDATIAFHPSGATEPRIDADGTFVWAIDDERGVYVANVDFPTAGPWVAEFTTTAPGAAPETIPFSFDVREDGSAVAIGEAAPASDTPTAADVGGDLSKLSTDPSPDPRFYETSVADAVAAGEPFVLAFATPAFCQTQQCGPTLDRVKAIAADYPDLTFINVEPYALEVTEDGALQPALVDDQGQACDDSGSVPCRLQPVQAVLDYGLLSEPFVFVVGGDGKVSASFEAVMSDEELRMAIDAVAG